MRAPWGGSTTTLGRRSHCICCGGDRIRWYTHNGEVVNRYRMRDGYYHDRSLDDEPAPTRREWRQRLVTSLMDLGVPDAKPATTIRAAKRTPRKAAAS